MLDVVGIDCGPGHRRGSLASSGETTDRARQFEADFRSLFPLWRKTVGLGQGRIPQMIVNRTAVGTAKHLLGSPDLSPGFVRLRDGGQLLLTVEFLVLRREFGSLFTREERGIARRKLTENGMPRDSLPLEPYS